MMKKIIEKEITEYGHIYLRTNFGNSDYFLYFEDETEFQAFLFMLRTMVSMNAASVGVVCPDPKEPEPEVTEEE